MLKPECEVALRSHLGVVGPVFDVTESVIIVLHNTVDSTQIPAHKNGSFEPFLCVLWLCVEVDKHGDTGDKGRVTY